MGDFREQDPVSVGVPPVPPSLLTTTTDREGPPTTTNTATATTTDVTKGAKDLGLDSLLESDLTTTLKEPEEQVTSTNSTIKDEEGTEFPTLSSNCLMAVGSSTTTSSSRRPGTTVTLMGEEDLKVINDLYLFLLQIKLINTLELIRSVCTPWGVPPNGNDFLFHFDHIVKCSSLNTLQEYELIFEPIYSKLLKGDPKVLWSLVEEIDYFKVVFKLECLRYKQPYDLDSYRNIINYYVKKLDSGSAGSSGGNDIDQLLPRTERGTVSSSVKGVDEDSPKRFDNIQPLLLTTNNSNTTTVSTITGSPTTTSSSGPNDPAPNSSTTDGTASNNGGERGVPVPEIDEDLLSTTTDSGSEDEWAIRDYDQSILLTSSPSAGGGKKVAPDETVDEMEVFKEDFGDLITTINSSTTNSSTITGSNRAAISATTESSGTATSSSGPDGSATTATTSSSNAPETTDTTTSSNTSDPANNTASGETAAGTNGLDGGDDEENYGVLDEDILATLDDYTAHSSPGRKSSSNGSQKGDSEAEDYYSSYNNFNNGWRLSDKDLQVEKIILSVLNRKVNPNPSNNFTTNTTTTSSSGSSNGSSYYKDQPLKAVGSAVSGRPAGRGGSVEEEEEEEEDEEVEEEAEDPQDDYNTSMATEGGDNYYYYYPSGTKRPGKDDRGGYFENKYLEMENKYSYLDQTSTVPTTTTTGSGRGGSFSGKEGGRDKDKRRIINHYYPLNTNLTSQPPAAPTTTSSSGRDKKRRRKELSQSVTATNYPYNYYYYPQQTSNYYYNTGNNYRGDYYSYRTPDYYKGLDKDKETRISSHVVSASVSYDKRQQRFMAQWKTKEGTKHSKSFYAKRYASPIMARKHAELYKMYILQHRVVNANELVEPTYEQLLANNFKDLEDVNVGELDYDLS